MKRKQSPIEPLPAEVVERKAMMALLAHSQLDELADGLRTAGFENPRAFDLRPPQVGLIMIRGRQGATGKPFNLGEATVTRAAVQTSDGLTGVSYILGRAPEKARLAALTDALWQSPTHRPAIEQAVMEPIRKRLAAARQIRRRQTAATTVDFYTMVRGDD